MDEGEIETLDEEYLEETSDDKTIRVSWNHTSTLYMLNTYIQLIPKSDNFLTKRHFFEGVSLALEKNDIFFSGYQIENKFRGLLRRHRLSKRRGDFFSKMNKIVSLDSTINDENYLIPASDNEDDVDEQLPELPELPEIIPHQKVRRPKKYWAIDDVHKLVDLYEEFLPEKPNYSLNINWWKLISSKLRAMGVMVTATNCEMKWNNILKFYKSKGVQYGPRMTLHKKIEKIRLSLGMDIATDVGTAYDAFDDQTLDDDEDDYFTPSNTKENTVVKTEPTTNEIEPEFIEIPRISPELVVVDERLVETNQSFEEKIMNYLQNKEIAKQRRHEENMELKKKQLLLLEKFCSSQNKK